MLKIILNKKISFLTGILLAFIFLYYFSYGNFEKNFEELATIKQKQHLEK